MPPMRKKNVIEVTNSSTNDETSISDIMQTKANNSKESKETKETKNKDDYCKELKNIAYKTMLLNGQEIVPEINNTNNNILSNFLENESCANKKENWSKLDKTQKIKKLITHIDNLQKKYKLSDDETSKCHKYLLKCLERKALSKVKDVIYDKETGLISEIPNLHFDSIERVFILKKDDKHVSTVKCLPLETKSKAKTIKIYD
jgi:hypothetical protein|uniref:Uncharacterized protein n=1 Tax=viral metagenome TaxID=1070528 RepID=A0A6C0KTQ1_9ZZZZ